MKTRASRLAFGLTHIVLCSGALLLGHAGCNGSERQSTTSADVAAAAAAAEGNQSDQMPVTARPTAENPLNGERAFAYLSQLCKLGSRASGTRGMTRQRAMLVKFFEDRGAEVELQEFLIAHPLTGKRVRCANLIARWHPETTDRVLLCAHYDTRPLPDRDPNPRRRREGTFVGANDGASGVAALMEIANYLPDADLEVGVDMVLFDAEELVYFDGFRGERGEYFLGSIFFAEDYRDNPPPHQYRWGVLLDMVGDTDLELLQERYSMSWPDTRPLVLDIWRTAARLGVEEFVPRSKSGPVEGFIKDDHLPLRNIARIPSCDIIDAEYPDAPFGHPGSYWHTEKDIPANCSGDSLAKVGWVVLEWLKSLQPKQQ